jgi:hypothetical protein
MPVKHPLFNNIICGSPGLIPEVAYFSWGSLPEDDGENFSEVSCLALESKTSTLDEEGARSALARRRPKPRTFFHPE